MIVFIWAFYMVFLFFQDILALNFLIAIVSQSYERIMDRQTEAIIESRDDLNLQYCRETNMMSDKDVMAVILRTAKEMGADSEWDGVSQNIKK